MTLRSNLMLAGLSTIVAIAMLEIALRLLTPYPITEDSNKTPHPKLGYVLSSDFPEIDAAGFRNPSQRLDSARIAIIGDSHTYGENVVAADNYPSILSQLTGKPVYNFGVNSYGIYQYKVLLDQLLDSSIDTVIVTLFVYNDYALTCSATETAYWQQYAADNALTLPDCGAENPRTRLGRTPIGALVRNTASWQLLRATMQPETAQPENLTPMVPVSIDLEHVVPERLLEIITERGSLEIPEVAINFANAGQFFAAAQTAYTAADKRLLFVLIPSRPLVTYTLMKEDQIEVTPEYEQLIAHLLELKGATINLLQDRQIHYVDALPYVSSAARATAATGERFYRGSHPGQPGYQAYAVAAAEGVSELQAR